VQVRRVQVQTGIKELHLLPKVKRRGALFVELLTLHVHDGFLYGSFHNDLNVSLEAFLQDQALIGVLCWLSSEKNVDNMEPLKVHPGVIKVPGA
jgi:hypothetical protein